MRKHGQFTRREVNRSQVFRTLAAVLRSCFVGFLPGGATSLIDVTDLPIVTVEQDARWHKRAPRRDELNRFLERREIEARRDVSSHS
jgi:hypothetical protein